MKQRPIKFRAWHTDEYPVKELRETMLQHDQLSIDGCLDGMKHGNLILMQFTGLTDQKGAEVYEGDVVEIQYEEDGKMVSVYDQIAFMGGCFGIVDKYHKGEIVCFSMIDLKDSQIVGTVFTHGHLLKDAKEEDDMSVWDARRYAGITDVTPLFSKIGKLTNWVEWEQAFREAMAVDKYVQAEVNKVDWADLRTVYFNDFISALGAYRDHFYPEPSEPYFKNWP